MLLSRDVNHGDFEIRSYRPGLIKINELTYDYSIILGKDTLVKWRPQTLEEFTPDDLAPLFDLQPAVVLLGVGEHAAFIPEHSLQGFYERQIGIEVMTTDSACRTFNVLMSEGRNVVAALLIR